MLIGTVILSLVMTAVNARGATLTAHLQRTFHAHTAVARQVAFSPDSGILVTSSADGTVKLWQVSDGRLIRVLTHPAGITSVAFSPDGQWIATGSYDHEARLWRVRDGALARTFRAHTGTIWSVAYSPDGQRIATCGEDKTIRIWRVTDGALLLTLRGHARNVWHVAFTPDGRYVASGSFDKTARLWRADSGALVRTFAGHEEAIVGVDISADGQLLATGSDDSTVRIWRISDGRLLRTLHAGNHVYSVAFSPDGQWIVSGGRERGALGTLWKEIAGTDSDNHGVTVRLWRVADGLLQQSLTAHTDDVMYVAWSRDGRWVASGSEDKSVKLWRIAVRY